MLLRKRCNFLMPDPCLLKEEGKNFPEQQLGKGDEAFGGNMASTFPDGTSCILSPACTSICGTLTWGSPHSWYVTMQICVVSFLNWKNDLGLRLRELRPWRVH